MSFYSVLLPFPRVSQTARMDKNCMLEQSDGHKALLAGASAAESQQCERPHYQQTPVVKK
jgi:hypothetical protein